jgi:phage-related protein
VATLFRPVHFTFSPSAQTQGSQPPRVLKAQFGDGYAQRLKDGDINSIQIWNLAFTDRSPSELKVIDDFLDSFHGVDAFLWQPPPPFGVGWFCCKDWDFEYGEGELMTSITAQFVQQSGASLPDRLIIVSGDFQTGAVGTTLPNLLVVKVIDSNGDPVAGFPLAWSVVAGGGHITATSTLTNALGTAEVALTLGPIAVTDQVRVVGAGLAGSPAIFLEYAVAPTDNWAGNDFDWMPTGPTTDVGTEVNVGDTALGIPTFSNFPRFIAFANWAGQSFDALTVGAITTPGPEIDVGDTSLSTGHLV